MALHKHERLGYADAAKYAGVSERTLRSARARRNASGQRELQGYGVGRSVEFTREELDRWLAERRDR